MAEPTTRKKTSSSMMPDWSLLPEDLLQFISTHLDNCFDVIHARSVCRQWRSTFPFPSCLLRQTFSLPSRPSFTLERIPFFLFRVRNLPATTPASVSDYLLGGIRLAELDERMELPSPLQCSVKVEEIYYPTLINFLDSQTLPLGHTYRLICLVPTHGRIGYKGVAFLPLNNEDGGGGEFVVLNNCREYFSVLRSSDMKWVKHKINSRPYCQDIVAFRGIFCAVFNSGEVFVIHPNSLSVAPLKTPQLMTRDWFDDPLYYLVPSGNDEIFLVKISADFEVSVCKLDDDTDKWIEVSDLGDRILFVGEKGNFSCSAKEIPNGCGLSGNSVVFTTEHKLRVLYIG